VKSSKYKHSGSQEWIEDGRRYRVLPYSRIFPHNKMQSFFIAFCKVLNAPLPKKKKILSALLAVQHIDALFGIWGTGV